MDSLDALRRWDAKRATHFEKIAKQNARTIVLPERAKVKFRTRPGEVTREDFASWVGALTPDSGVVNEFRKKMYQSELRGLENYVMVNDKAPHPGWALWQPRTYQQPAYDVDKPTGMYQGVDGTIARQIERHQDRKEMLKPRTSPGIEPFFYNTINEAPLRGAGLSGGALTQLSRTNAKTESISDRVQDLARQQARQATAFRQGAIAGPAPPPIYTALDEAKLLIGTTIETIAQQILRGIYSSDILRDLTSITSTVARNAPLMESGPLGELLRYLNDLLLAMRNNAKNTGKEIAEDNLLEFGGEPEFYGDTWRAVIGNPDARADQATARDLDKGVKQSELIAESIYARVEALTEFVRQQFAVSERPLAERIQVARAGLPRLGTNIDRKTYPADLRKRFEKQEAEAKQKTEMGDLLDLAEVQPVEVAQAVGLEPAGPGGGGEDLPLYPADLPALRISEIPVEEMAQLEGFQESAPATSAERAARIATVDAEILDLLAEAGGAVEAGDVRREQRLVRKAFSLAVSIGDTERQKAIKRAAKARGFNPDRRVVAPIEEGAEEEAVGPAFEEEEEEVVEAAPAVVKPAGASASTVPAGKVLLSREEVDTLFSKLINDARTGDLTGDTKIPRKGEAISYINPILTVKGRTRIYQTKGEITVRELMEKLDKAGVLMDSPDGPKPFTMFA